MAEPGDLLRLDPALVHLLDTHRAVHLRDLHGHSAVQPGVESLVHPPEAADSDQGVEAVSIRQGPRQVQFRMNRLGLADRRGTGHVEGLVEPIDLAQLLDLPTELVEPIRAIPAQLLRRRGMALGLGLLPANDQFEDLFTASRHRRLSFALKVFAVQGVLEQQAGRGPSPLDRLGRHPQGFGRLGVGHPLIPDQAEHLTFLRG